MPETHATPHAEIIAFVGAFRAAMEFGCFDLKARDKNMRGLAALGLTIDGMKKIIAGLAVENFVAGPEPDDTDETKEVWKFGCRVEQTEVYIKLRLAPETGKKNVNRATVWSFHKAEHSLRYPHKGA